MENIGLVFCGGGAKGAYQIGVIRVLEEFGLCHNVQAISGASIGGINPEHYFCNLHLKKLKIFGFIVLGLLFFQLIKRI